MKLVLSYVRKRDVFGEGSEIATAVKNYLEQFAVPRIFESVLILDGEATTSAVEAMIIDSAVIYIVTDRMYDLMLHRPWCLSVPPLASRSRRPVVGIDARSDQQGPLSPLAANIPFIRLATGSRDKVHLEQIANLIVREVIGELPDGLP